MMIIRKRTKKISRERQMEKEAMYSIKMYCFYCTKTGITVEMIPHITKKTWGDFRTKGKRKEKKRERKQKIS